jgi:hypothetical protein
MRDFRAQCREEATLLAEVAEKLQAEYPDMLIEVRREKGEPRLVAEYVNGRARVMAMQRGFHVGLQLGSNVDDYDGLVKALRALGAVAPPAS